MNFAPLGIVLSLLLASGVAFAHGGEDHGEPAPAAPATNADGPRTAWGRSTAFEVLLKYRAAPTVTDEASLLVFVSDASTNAPVGNAKLELELSGPSTAKLAAESTATPGVYHVVGKLAPGSYGALVTIEAGTEIDVVEVKGIDLALAPAAAAKATPHEERSWLPIGVGATVLAFGLGVYAWRRRGRRHVAAAATTLGVILAIPLLARAHGGEDHGEEPAPAATATPKLPAGSVYMAKESQFLLGVRTARVSERDVEARIEAVGRVIPRADGHATIAAPQPGRVIAVANGKLPFLGDRVKKGQPLFVLEQTLGAADASSVQAQALQARSAIAQARARRDQAQRELERRRSLAGVIAKKEIEQAALELELADKELALARQQSSLFGGVGLRRVTVTAPIDGTIAEANVSLGDQIAADKIVYTVIDSATLWVEANVFEADVPRIEQTGTADIRVEGYAGSFRGDVYRIGQVVDPATRTVKVLLAVDNPQGRLRTGTFARVAVGAGGKRRVLAIPDAAVIEEGGRRFAFVHESPEVFVRREIVLGARDGDVWAVEAGLKAGERVVTQGTYQLRTSR